jgi:hypothetical protein
MYVVAYLLLTGLALALVPRQALALMGATADYGVVMPRWVGMFSIALATVIGRALHHRLTVLYPLGFFMPGAMLFGFASMYVQSRDPLFLAVSAVVAVGVVLSGTCLWLDRRRGAR